MSTRLLHHALHPGALFGGFVFAFCPYKLQHIEGHIQLMATETLPLVALSLIRLYDRPSRRHIAWAGIWIGLTIHTDYYYFAYAILMVGVIVLYRLVTDSNRLTLIRNTALSGLLAFLIAAPLLIPALVSASRSDYAITAGHDKHKADLLGPFVPSQRQWVTSPLRPIISRVIDMERVDGIEQSIYIGWGVLVLCVGFTSRILATGGTPPIFVLISGLFLLLAFGPTLQINGVNTFAGWKIYLPGWVLTELPVFEGARATARTFVITAVGLSVWVACSLRLFLARRSMLEIRSEFITAGIVAVTMLEYIIPVGMSELDDPAWTEIVAKDEKPGILVHVPQVPQMPAFWQHVTDRKEMMVNLGRADQDLASYYWRHEALRLLTLPQYVGTIPSERDARYLVDLLGIRYVVLDLQGDKEERISTVHKALEDAYGLKQVYRDSTVALFRLEREHRSLRGMRFQTADTGADLHFPFGWSNRKPFYDKLVAWIIRERALLALPGIQEGAYDLHLDLTTLVDHEVNINTEPNGFDAGSYTLHKGETRISIPLPESAVRRVGPNILALYPDRTAGFPQHTGYGTVRGQAGIPIEIKSGGRFTSLVGHSEIRVGDQKISSMRRGILVATIDSHAQVDVAQFESLVPETTVHDLADYLRDAPDDVTVAIAIRTISDLHGGNLGQAFRLLGLPEQMELNPLNSLAILGGKDGRVPVIDTGAAIARIGTSNSQRKADVAIGLLGLELTRR